MRGAGNAWLGVGMGSGDKRAEQAAKNAITSPLLEISLSGAKGLVVNIAGNKNISLHEVKRAMGVISNSVDPEANIIFGVTIDEELGDQMKIIVIATNFQPKYKKEAMLEGLESDILTPDDLKIPPFLRRKRRTEEE